MADVLDVIWKDCNCLAAKEWSADQDSGNRKSHKYIV